MRFMSFEIFNFILTELARTVMDISNASVLTSDLVGMFTFTLDDGFADQSMLLLKVFSPNLLMPNNSLSLSFGGVEQFDVKSS